MQYTNHIFNEVFRVGCAFFLLFSVPSVAATQTCVQPPSGLVSWWRGEGDATDTMDGNHGILANGATFAPGMVGQAFSFDGSDDGVLIGNPANLQLQDFTIDAWIKRGSLVVAGNGDSTNEGEIVAYGHDGYGLGLFPDGQLFLSKVDTDFVASGSSLRVTDTDFHHVAVTKSGTTVIFYIDGTPTSAPITYSSVFAFFAENVSLGARLDARLDLNPPNTATFIGLQDEITIFNRALAAAEIQAIFAAGSAGKCVPSAPVRGSVTGVSPSKVRCRNVTTGQKVVIRNGARAWDCEAAGLVVTPGDTIRQTVTGTAD
jgi:hypothetical protein